MISEILFPTPHAKSEALYVIHKWTSYFCLGLFAIHIAIHGKYLVRAFHEIISGFHQKNVRRPLIRLGAIALLAVLLYTKVVSSLAAGNEQINQPKNPIVNSHQNTYSADSAEDSNSRDYPERGNPRSGKNRTNSSAFTDNSPSGDIPSLSEYLSALYCTGCHKHCSLLYPQCDKGESFAEAATAEYQRIYGSAAD
jgi:hypothetical protein